MFKGCLLEEITMNSILEKAGWIDLGHSRLGMRQSKEARNGLGQGWEGMQNPVLPEWGCPTFWGKQ